MTASDEATQPKMPPCALRLDHAQPRLLKFREIRTDAILHDHTFIAAVIGLSDRGVDANLRRDAAHDELGDAAVLSIASRSVAWNAPLPGLSTTGSPGTG
jgi:hypothetical protein